MAVSSIVALILTPLLFDFLRARDFAILSFAIAATGLLGAIDFGIGTSLVRFVSILAGRNLYRELDELVATVFFLLAGVGVAGTVAIVVLAPWMVHYFSALAVASHKAFLAVALVGLSLAFDFPSVPLSAYIAGCQDLHLLSGVEIAVQFLRIIAITGLLLAGFGLAWVAGVFPVIAFSRFAGLLWACRRSANPWRPHLADVRFRRLREMGKFALFASLEDTAGRYYLLMDTFVAAKFLPLADLAILSVARRIPLALRKLADQPYSAAYPLVSAAAADGKDQQIRRFMLVSVRASLAFGLPVAAGLWLWAATILRLWVGPAVLSGVTVFRLMIVLAIFLALHETPMTFLLGAGKIGFCTVVTVAMLPAFAILGGVASVRYQLNGLAAAYALVCAVATILVFSRALSVSEVSWVHWLRKGVIPGLFLAAPAIVWLIASYSFLPHTLLGLIESWATASAIFVGVVFALASKEKHRSWKDRIWSALLEER